MKNPKVVVGVLTVAVILVVIGIFFLLSDASKDADARPAQKAAQQIPKETYFNEVKKLSAGDKPACLAPDPALEHVVKDDESLPYEKSFSPAIGTVIIDMPAGYTDVYLHSYTPTRASGYEVFSDKNQESFVGELKTFNFTIERASADSTWTVKSFIACSE